jgi:hypothetical protein
MNAMKPHPMAEETLWEELLALAEAGMERSESEPYRKAYGRLARAAALCGRLGVDAGGKELLKKEEPDRAEVEAFFRKVWRLATLRAESRKVDRMEARRGVDRDAADFRQLRETLDGCRTQILEFQWLPEKQKRGCMDKLEAITRDLQRARDDFDVALAHVTDPEIAAEIDTRRPSFWREAGRRIALFLGPAPVDNRSTYKSLPPPDPREEK